MPSEPDFLNEALALIGADPITAIDDGTTNANHCARLYPATRRAALRSSDWNFAGHIVVLSALVTPPTGWAYGYTLPQDYIKLRIYYPGGSTSASLYSPYYSGETVVITPAYEIQGNVLCSNDGEAAIKYTRDRTDPNQWDSLFYNMLAQWLASKFATAIAKDTNLANSLLQQALVMGLPLAAAIGGQEQSQTAYVVDNLTRGR